MAYQKHILLGRITRVHRFDGVVTVKLEKYFSEKIPELESVFIEIDDRPVPFFITSFMQPDNLTLRLQFQAYESDTKIKEFTGCKVYLTKELNLSVENSMGFLLNFKVTGPGRKQVGIIKEIIEQPGHLLLNIETPAKHELLLPLHEDLINSIDKKNKTIDLIIPDGIEEIN
jgi:16S rRNA processing protein RimM